jgi:hypothetical protein
MPLDGNRIARGTSKKREAKWDALNATSDGAYQARVRVLLRDHPKLNALDARIKTVAEEGWSDEKIQDELGIAEQTLYNHIWKMRKIAKVGRDVPFRLLFLLAKNND